MDGLSTLNNVLKDGDTAIVAGLIRKSVGHAFNAIKTDGVIKFVDGQNAKIPNLDTYISFKYLKTKKVINYAHGKRNN